VIHYLWPMGGPIYGRSYTITRIEDLSDGLHCTLEEVCAPAPVTTAALVAGGAVRLNAYAVIARAVEEGALAGVRQAHKHTDTPNPEEISDAVLAAVLNSLSEVLDYDNE